MRTESRKLRTWLLVPFAAVIFSIAGVSTAFASHVIVQNGHIVHWSDNAPTFPRAYMYWKDMTGPEWPVYAAAIEWDSSSRLDALYTSGSCTSSHCVSVVEGALDPGCSGRLGETTLPSGATTGHLGTDTEIRIDDDCGTQSYADRRELVCHEMGHSIGLNERPWGDDTCMRQGWMAGHQVPDQHDFNTLYNDIYSHSD